MVSASRRTSRRLPESTVHKPFNKRAVIKVLHFLHCQNNHVFTQYQYKMPKWPQPGFCLRAPGRKLCQQSKLLVTYKAKVYVQLVFYWGEVCPSGALKTRFKKISFWFQWPNGSLYVCSNLKILKNIYVSKHITEAFDQYNNFLWLVSKTTISHFKNCKWIEELRCK